MKRLFPAVMLTAAVIAAIQGPVLAADSPGAAVGKTVERIVAAYGGRAAFSAISSSRSSGTIVSLFSNDHGTYERMHKRDRKLRVDIRYTRSSELRVLAGAKGYRGANGARPVEVSGPPLAAMVYQYAYTDMPFELLTGRYRVFHDGTETAAGVTADVLRLETGHGLVMKLFADRATGRIVKSTAYFGIGTVQTDLSAEFSDFRAVGPTVMPFTITNYSGGTKISVTTITSIVPNAGGDEKLYEP